MKAILLALILAITIQIMFDLKEIKNNGIDCSEDVVPMGVTI